jgi:hydrogenase expression/formation protein HypE
MMHQMIRDYFVPAFDLKTLHDSAVIDNLPKGKIAITTDSYVISPYFFPGGDIGMLAVCGTVNDLSMAGARPLYLTTGFIIEEGFPFDHLKKILDSMQAISKEIGVQIIAGEPSGREERETGYLSTQPVLGLLKRALTFHREISGLVTKSS